MSLDGARDDKTKKIAAESGKQLLKKLCNSETFKTLQLFVTFSFLINSIEV
jgi:hypothetical protein